MKHPALLFMASLLLASCGDRLCAEATDDLELVDTNNYNYEGILDFQSTALAPGDFSFAWAGLTRDLQGHDLDPIDDIDNASVVVFRYLDQQQVLEGLAENTLEQASVGLFVSKKTEDGTELDLSELTLLGTDIDVEEHFTPESCDTDGYCTWLLTLATGTTPSVGTRVAAFVEPSAAASATHLDVTDDSSSVTVHADLQSLEPVAVPAGEPALEVDWSEITQSGQGVDIKSAAIDQIMVASYDLSLAELEEQFLDIELIANELWSMEFEGSSADLSELQGFSGVDTDHTWILALRCSTCANPAPPVLTVLEGCE